MVEQRFWESGGRGGAAQEVGSTVARRRCFFIQWLTVNDVQDVMATKHNDLAARLDNLLVQRSVEVDFIYIFVIFKSVVFLMNFKLVYF
jgi:hypothetical protein